MQVMIDLSAAGSMVDGAKAVLDSEGPGFNGFDLASTAGDGIDVTQSTALPLGPDNVLYPEHDPIGFSAFFDIPSGTSTFVNLPAGYRINAEISFTGDTDWFRMSFVQGHTYQISLKSLPFFGFGLGDPQLYLFDNNGSFLTANDNGGSGNDALLTVTATRTGIYYAGATGFGGGQSTTGQYQITLSEVNFAADIVGDIPSLAAPINTGTTINGTVDYIGDEDWYAVTVVKGQSYNVYLEGSTQSFNPLVDPNLEVVDAQLNVIASNNDYGVTSNSHVAFKAAKSGTFYVKAMGSAESTGDFTLSVVEFTPPPKPDPLDGIDWGVKFDKTQIKYYFAAEGETYWDNTNESPWTNYEKGQAAGALGEYSKFSLLTFTEVTNPDNADFIITKSFLDSGLTGKMVPQDPNFGDIQGIGWFNTNPTYWSDKAGGLLEKGAYGYSNFMHEFGHGLGLAHPHDNAGGMGIAFDGVLKSADFGTFKLNQEVFTVMSYNKGWIAGPVGGSGTNLYGISRTPMAFDIAVIQEKYGINTSYASGNNVYTLVSENVPGTGYEAIWDTGGRDTIRHDGSAKAFFDLRDATLKLANGGGGFVSYVDGIFGGFTIANGVVIENAVGGNGNDKIVGNEAGNALRGRGGVDRLKGLDGADVLIGSAGNDNLNGGNQSDILKGGSGRDRLIGGNGGDDLIGGGGGDVVTGGKGNDAFIYKSLLEIGDRITDFSAVAGNNDRFEFKGKAFGGLAKGEISASEFQSSNSAVAKTADVRFFYEQDTGILRFDADGNGAGLAVTVAKLQIGATITASDFLII